AGAVAEPRPDARPPGGLPPRRRDPRRARPRHLPPRRHPRAPRGAPRAPRPERALRRPDLDGRPPRASEVTMSKSLRLFPMSDEQAELADLALRAREHIVRMATRGGCFIGASLSCADILVHLYKRVLAVAPDRADDRDRDYLFLSKGHDVAALYAVLAELGFFPRARLARHLDPADHLYWHPNR